MTSTYSVTLLASFERVFGGQEVHKGNVAWESNASCFKGQGAPEYGSPTHG
jgi:hypothetical protein